MALSASPPSAPSLVSAHPKAMICYPYQPITLSTSLLWLGLNPTLQHPRWQDYTSDSFFSLGGIFAQVGSPAVLALRDVTGKAAPICSVPDSHPSAEAD